MIKRAKENIKMSDNRSAIHFDQVFFALAVIFFGTLALMENLDVDPHFDFWRFWPVSLILIGLGDLLKKPFGKHAFGGFVFVGVGGFWLAENVMNNFDISIWQLWPLLLIGLGIKLLLEKKTCCDGEPSRLAGHKSV
jgi:hypothetical protein